MCTPDAAAEKARLRREMLCIRREIPREAREEASRCIEAGLREWLLRQPVRRVFCYVSYAEEVETHCLLAWMAARGIAVRAGLHCAPLAHRTAGTLETGTVRISPSVFTSARQVERFAAEVQQIVRENVRL